MRLSELAANAEVKYELAEAMHRRSLPHAVLIEGEKGCGKRTLAGILAEYAVCSAEGDRPCGVCPNCLKAQKGIHPDIVWADGNQSGALNIEAIRNIRSGAYIKPNEAENKVYVLLQCEKMLIPAQNAFLKVLEEPPAHVLFVLTSVSATSLLPTIRSRVRTFSLYPPSVDEAAKVVQRMRPDQPLEQLTEAVQRTGGNIGAAITLLDSGGEEEQQAAEAIYRAIPMAAEYPLLLQTSRIVQNRAFALSVLNCLCDLAAECVKAGYGVKDVSPTAASLAEGLSRRRLAVIQRNVQQARSVLNYNVNLNFYGTWLCAALRRNENGGSYG